MTQNTNAGSQLMSLAWEAKEKAKIHLKSRNIIRTLSLEGPIDSSSEEETPNKGEVQIIFNEPKRAQTANSSSRRPQKSQAPFNRQSGHKIEDFLKANAHELRFQNFNNQPMVCSNTKRVPNVYFSKVAPRKYNPVIDMRPQLHIKYDFAQKSTASPGIEFKQRPRRRSQILRHLTNLTYSNVDYSGIDKATKAPVQYKKALSRPKHPKLPSFMLKPEDRPGLVMISDKSLEDTSYSTSHYLPSTSTFPTSNKLQTLYSKKRSPSPLKKYRIFKLNK